MKRKIALILAVLLLLTSVGCGQTPAEELAGETTGATDATHGSTQPQPESEPSATHPQVPTEQTQAPTEQTQAPTEQTQASTEQSQAPTQQTQASTELPATPTESTQMPTEQTKKPTVPSTQPTEPTGLTEPTQSAQPTQPEEIPETTPVTEAPGNTGCQHDYQQTHTKAATCTAAGSKKFVCSKCGTVMRQEIPAKGHSYKAATCLLPKTCTGCGGTEGAALGHSYGAENLCVRCCVKDPNASMGTSSVNFTATIRSDEGVSLSGVTVTVSTDTETKSAVTDQNGKTTIALSGGSSQYTVKLSNVPEGYEVKSSYSFSSALVTINLKSLPVRSDPNDHSKARYEEGDKMMEFTITDVDGRTYNLSELLQENKLVILDFWYVSCNPCKKEFPYFESALEAYGDDVVLLAVDPFYSATDIRKLRDEMGLSFPVFQDPLGLSGGFQVTSYPTTVFIDSTGTIRRIHRGAFSDEASFLRAVVAYL